MLIPYLLTFISASMYIRDLLPCKNQLCYYNMCHTNWCNTVTQILANKIVITTFSLIPVKLGINHTAAMGIFVWSMKQVYVYGIKLYITYVY